MIVFVVWGGQKQDEDFPTWLMDIYIKGSNRQHLVFHNPADTTLLD